MAVGRPEFAVTVDYGVLPEDLIAEHISAHMVNTAAAAAVNMAGPFVQRALSQNTPVGATGKARQSVVFEPAHPFSLSGEITGFVGYGAPASLYIGFANDGTRAHFPPVTPLTYWAARKLGDARLGYAIANTIAKFGTRPQRFVERTRDEVETEAVELLRSTFMSHLTGLTGGI